MKAYAAQRNEIMILHKDRMPALRSFLKAVLDFAIYIWYYRRALFDAGWSSGSSSGSEPEGRRFKSCPRYYHRP
jgi:hypothetical protein